jgi:hypothetical protein
MGAVDRRITLRDDDLGIAIAIEVGDRYPRVIPAGGDWLSYPLTVGRRSVVDVRPGDDLELAVTIDVGQLDSLEPTALIN